MKNDLRERCREAYGDGFVEMYDKLKSGEPIGDFWETTNFLLKLEEVRQQMMKNDVKEG